MISRADDPFLKESAKDWQAIFADLLIFAKFFFGVLPR
jgi:hypothetical protein